MNQEQLELIKRVQAGEPGAFENLYKEFYYVVYYFVLKKCKNGTDAKDITQETFLRVVNNIHNLREPHAFKSWLYRIAISQINMFYRKKSDALYNDDIMLVKTYEEENIEYIPHRKLRELADREIVQKLMLNLSHKRREVIHMYHFEQKTLDEIAIELDIPFGTVKTRLFEGRRALKKSIKEFECNDGRKLTFRLHGGLTSILSLYVISYLQKILSKQKYMHVLQASSIVICCVSATVAISKSVTLYTDVQQVEQATADNQEQSLTNSAFSTLQYKGQAITSNKDAFFALLSFAEDETSLRNKSYEELVEIKPVVNMFVRESSAYQNQMEGWVKAYQALIKK